MSNSVKKDVQEYYGDILKSKDDLKTSACCPIDSMDIHLRPLLKNIHETVQEKFYGCGSPIPYSIEGKTILDLGCGTGRDVYLASQLVGKDGHVIGIDMTDNQLNIASQHVGYHMDKFGYDKANVTFHKAYIEDLNSVGIKDNSVDIVISNCVINLSDNKEKVFREIFRILKPGGELYFSDIFTGQRVPSNLTHDPILLGECLGGALYIEDFRRLLRNVGCLDYRVVSKGQIELHDQEIVKKAGMIDFYSMSIRTFKCEFEDICEDYGHVAYYRGTIEEAPHAFKLDDHHIFKTNQPVRICGNTALMLSTTRYKEHFKIDGNFENHYGPFDCNDMPGNLNIGGCC